MDRKVESRPLGWTTLEEIQRLLEAGLRPDTADMCYQRMGHKDDKVYISSALCDKPEEDDIPCWSLGALLELLPKHENIMWGLSFGHGNEKEFINECCSGIEINDKFVEFGALTYIEAIVKLVEYCLNNDYIKKGESNE